MNVPMHVWRPAELESTVGKRVVVSTVAGPEEVAQQLKQKLLDTAPRDSGRETTLIDAASLQSKTKIRLVSATDDQPNDLALASVARREGVDYVLRGEVIENRYATQTPDPNAKLKISWRLAALDGKSPVNGKPVVVDVKSAIERYPDLGVLSDADQILSSAAARETFRLMTPSVDRAHVQLSVAYLMPGSHDVRRGNASALAGRWGEAESIWLEVLEMHPTQVAAIHNLALAAAAGQDFSRAKQLARNAIRLQPWGLHQQTLVWIELNQRAYHKSFGLPDPPEGWFVTSESQ
jgi:hypothetical protein